MSYYIKNQHKSKCCLFKIYQRVVAIDTSSCQHFLFCLALFIMYSLCVEQSIARSVQFPVYFICQQQSKRKTFHYTCLAQYGCLPSPAITTSNKYVTAIMTRSTSLSIEENVSYIYHGLLHIYHIKRIKKEMDSKEVAP